MNPLESDFGLLLRGRSALASKKYVKMLKLAFFLLLLREIHGGVDVGRAKAKISAEEMLKLHRKRRDDDKLFSINSPRKDEAKQSDIHIKLPDNISEQMAKGQRERSRLRDAFLGFPASLDPTETTSESPPSYFSTETQTEHKISHPKQPRTWEEIEETTTQGPISKTSQNTIQKSPQRSLPSILWDAHIYFSGTLFVLLAIYCSANICRLHTFSRLFSRNYFVSLNLLLVLIGVLRPIWLFHDPYNEGKTWPRTVAYILVDTGLPCMTSAFAVLFLALLRATQIELVSPAFQTPKALAIFVFLHFAASQCVDVTIGMYFSLRYMVLINQGVFIVWSLLLSAGYFYIFSAMNKVSMRQQGDLIRSVYPKLILEGGNAYNEATGQMQPLSSAVLKKPPLARAVHLTLGVAVLGSLLGGVQLFAMIKMLGLIKQDYDLSPTQNQWAWYGYQVSMRLLEVTLCTLLAIIATTPLRSGENDASPASNLDDSCCCPRTKKGGFCCFGDVNPPREFEDEIYSEICSNNHSVRQVLNDGTMMALGTLNPNNSATLIQQQPQTNMLAMGSNTLIPYGHKRAQAAYATQSATLLRSSNHSYNGNAFQQGNNVNHRTSSGGVPNNVNSSTSSRMTLDTQLYSNIRSRPSSMLFNDSGFVRFRMNDEQNLEPVKTSEEMKKLRASQSFDEAVLDTQNQPQPRKSPIYHTASDPETKEDDDFEPELEAIYEPPPAANIAAAAILEPATRGQQVKKASLTTTTSESDEPQYSGQSMLYGARAPSQCSSISATQSFDLRMYGRLPKGLQQQTQNSAANSANTGTLKKNEETRERLENPYYYYGSTRNQKKNKMIQQKPRPLLPSQRAALEMQQRVPAFVSTQLPGERPKSRQSTDPPPQYQRPPSRPSSRQALLQEQNFTRSRSLGGYYQQQNLPPAPVRNQQLRSSLQGHQGSMTPLSYAKWQQANSAPPKRYNPLYDTPPTQRIQRIQQPLEIRGVMGNNLQGQQRPLLTEPVLSPILTDTEISPLHRTGIHPDYLTDPSDSDDAEMFTSQATQGYSEGLADNELESEVSSIFGVENPVEMPRNSESHISPLEYSAMLKLYRSAAINNKQSLKDTTPDSGVVGDHNSNSNSNQSTSSIKANLKVDSSQNSLLSSSSSTAAETTPIWQQRNGIQASSIQHHGKEYSRLEGNLVQADTLFSSENSSCDGEETETTDRPSFRWDGTPLVDKSKESKLLQKVKSLENSENETPPIPPIRESSVKREEIK